MNRINSFNWSVFITLGVASVVALFPVLWVQQDLWDGVIISYAYESNNLGIYSGWFSSAGWPLVTVLHSIVHSLGIAISVHAKLLINITIFLSIFGSAYEVYKLSVGVFRLDKLSGLCASLLFLVCPAWSLLVSSVFLMHAVFIYLCLLGTRLSLTSPRIFLRIVGVIIVMLSFQHGANPAIALPIFAFFFIFETEMDNKRRIELIVFACLSVAFFFLFRWVFHTSGVYEGYNEIKLNNFLNSDFYSQLWVYYIPIYSSIGFLIVLSVVHALVLSRKVEMFHFIFFLLFVLISLAPYLAVGKAPNIYSVWNNRFTFNTTIPIAFFLGFLVNSLPSSNIVFRSLAVIIAAFTISVSFLEMLKGYKTITIKLMDQAYFVEAFSKLKEPEKGDVEIKGWARRLNSYEVNYYLYLAFGKANWNTSPNEKLTQEYADKYAASDHELGCNTQMMVSENIYKADRMEALKFLFDQERFMAENKHLNFNVDMSESSCEN
jgi:hypothetical protein